MSYEAISINLTNLLVCNYFLFLYKHKGEKKEKSDFCGSVSDATSRPFGQGANCDWYSVLVSTSLADLSYDKPSSTVMVNLWWLRHPKRKLLFLQRYPQ